MKPEDNLRISMEALRVYGIEPNIINSMLSTLDYIVGNTIAEYSFWSLKTHKNYPEDRGCWEVVWTDIFMPFDVICGLDSCPPDNEDYSTNKKTHWWVCPRTTTDICSVHDISMFMELPDSKEFDTLEEAINYCLDWRKEWLHSELYKS